MVKRVYRQVQRQRRQEQKNKVPIELWAEQAQKIAGVHVDAISSAFSQVRNHKNVHVTISEETTRFYSVL